MIKAYESVIKKLSSVDVFRVNFGLDRVFKILSVLGNPQNSLKYIHVAGTNGKGSVCAMLESVLREAGYKTGIYTSPHIYNYTERIKICGKEISQKCFSEYFNCIDKIALKYNIKLTEFEILTVIMFCYFKDNQVDIVILETGMGGRFDATNVIKENICSIITRIDLDHVEKLGNTKEKIAFEKAGIIKKDCPIITAMKYSSIKNSAKILNSEVIYVSNFVRKKYLDALSLKGLQQKENLVLVLEVIKRFFPNIDEKLLLNGLKKVKHPCRFEYIKNKNLIIDVSHNPNGIEALRKNLDYYFPEQDRRFVFGCLKRKDYKTMMQILFRDCDEIYLNEFDYPDSCTYQELANVCPYKSKKYTSETKLTNNKLNIICGSFYMISKLII